MRKAYPYIAREGWPFLALAVAVAAGAVWALDWTGSIPFWLIAAFVAQFFRDPERVVPGDERSVVSPADGRIVAVESARDPWLERDAVKISVFMNVFNVHSNRSPVDGEVCRIWYHAGRFLNAALDKASTHNERNAVWLRARTGADVTCVQIAGLIARRILCRVRAGDRLARGERYGFIRFGSRVDIYLPSTASIRTALGDRVRGGSSVLALL